jgi:hypothetical protein
MQSSLALLFLLVIVAAVLPTARSRRARRRQLAALALRCGWTYSAGDPWDLPASIDGLWLGAWGHDRRCRDVFSVPSLTGSLWLAVFRRQMASGRHRRSECFALAVARLRAIHGGIAILPQGQVFVPADPFARYRPVAALEGVDLSGRQVWAERPAGERHILTLLAQMMSSLPPDAGLEVRGPVAAVYWPLPRPESAQEFLNLHAAGRRLLDLLGASPDATRADPKISSQASRESP